MTQPLWQAPKGKFQLYGVVTYHCASCSGAIAPEATETYVFVDDGRVLAEGEKPSANASTYHTEHIPSEVTNGR